MPGGQESFKRSVIARGISEGHQIFSVSVKYLLKTTPDMRLPDQGRAGGWRRRGTHQARFRPTDGALCHPSSADVLPDGGRVSRRRPKPQKGPQPPERRARGWTSGEIWQPSREPGRGANDSCKVEAPPPSPCILRCQSSPVTKVHLPASILLCGRPESPRAGRGRPRGGGTVKGERTMGALLSLCQGVGGRGGRGRRGDGRGGRGTRSEH